MTLIMKYVVVCAPLAFAAMLMDCSKGDRIAGAGSETTNGVIMGSVQNADGSPAARNTVVKLIRDDYDAVADSSAPSIDTTDSMGAFRFSRVDTGLFNVLARNDSAATGVLIRGIQVQKGDSPITALPGTLQKMGAVAVDFSAAVDTFAEYLYIPGTDIFAFVKGNSIVMLASVPAGIIPVLSYATKTGVIDTMRYEVPVTPEDTTAIRNPAWRYSREISFNTTSGGAGVGKDVYDFPVLIRLSGSNFNFGQARPDGRDIRYAKGDNSLLPFEIEAWDPVAGLAEVWVRIDTIFGNSTGQTITMYWGNPQAEAGSDAAAVFDTASGFQGVWHLSETPADSAHDATGNQYNGVSPDTGRPSVTQGMIGNCREFDGAASCIIMPNTADGKLNFQQDGNYTVSAWVLLDTLDSASYVVVSKGAFQYYLWYTYIYQNAPNWEFVEYEENGGWKCPTHPAHAKEWALLTGVCNGTSQYLYVNGELADTAIVTYSYTEPRNTATDFIIGRYIAKAGYPPGKLGGFCYFDGKIDEVRVSNRSLSAEWIRLCYMNQRTDDKLITFK